MNKKVAEFIVSNINNIMSWLQGEELLDYSRWSLELLKKIDQEEQKKVYKKFYHFGKIKKIGKVKTFGLDTYFLDFDYESSSWFLSVKLNETQYITSILFTPNNSVMAEHLPITKDFIEFVTEEYGEIKISNHLSLDAAICFPEKKKPKALVVFIQGSGALDKNENVGFSAPFFDLALGMAANNIANIRFDKRSWAYPFITINSPVDEIIDDAVCAAKLILRKFQNLDIPLIFLGHSQGANFVTQVATKLGITPQGFVLLAPPSDNDLHFRLLDQLDYLAQKDPTNKSIYLNMQNEVREALIHWENYKLSKIQGGQFLLNLPTEYLNYLDNYNPINEIIKMDIPVFVLQGSQDYKVLAKKDFVEWNNKLSTNHKATLKLYKNLEHCFVDAQLAEANKFAQVNSEVIQDVVDWILAL